MSEKLAAGGEAARINSLGRGSSQGAFVTMTPMPSPGSAVRWRFQCTTPSIGVSSTRPRSASR